MAIHPARRRLITCLASPDQQIDLADAALCIAWEDRDSGDPDATLVLLDHLADAAKPAIAGLTHPATIIAALNTYLFENLGFCGNSWSYGEPANSFLDHAIETRNGLPITLSILYVEIARRLGLPVVGVALPGHFIVRYHRPEAPGEDIFIDPFHGGRIWSYAECETQVQLFYGNVTPQLMQKVLSPPSARSILGRILRNLKGTYLERSKHAHALAAVERIILIEGESLNEVRDRGLLQARLGRLHLALSDLDQYVRGLPSAPDIDTIRRHAQRITDQIGKRN